MREIPYSLIENEIKNLCMDVNFNLAEDSRRLIEKALSDKGADTGKKIIKTLIENMKGNVHL